MTSTLEFQRYFYFVPIVFLLGTQGCIITYLGSESTGPWKSGLSSQDLRFVFERVHDPKEFSLDRHNGESDMYHLKLVYGFTVNPQCPICRRGLVSDATVFHRNLALCSHCFSSADNPKLPSIYEASNSFLTYGWFTNIRGLRFFTPPAHVPSRVSLDLLVESLGKKSLTPSEPWSSLSDDLTRSPYPVTVDAE